MPELTTEVRSQGRGLDEYPYPIDTESPHRPHFPITDFAGAGQGDDGRRVFRHPRETSADGLYGRYWAPPRPPRPGAWLRGIRFLNAQWTGTAQNTIVVYSLIDTRSGDCAGGRVSNALQGLKDQLCAVDTTPGGEEIELRLMRDDPMSWQYMVAVIDTENLPQGYRDIIYPRSVSVDRIEWLWAS